MANKRLECGRGVFYTRDSGGKHEQTPAQYIEQSRRDAEKLGVTFSGTADMINEMVALGESVGGDIYLDYDVEGHFLSRPALDALQARVQTDLTVSHVFMPNRTRLARPQNALDGVKLEEGFRRMGVSVVYFGKVLPPIGIRQRSDIGEVLTAVVEFNESGKFRRDLAEKMVYTQLALAQNGCSTGGRSRFGFRRTLVSADGTIVRPLADGEIVRQKGHHVLWLPGDEEDLALGLRIREMLKAMPAGRVAAQLNAEGIPSPDAGRSRHDNGVKHIVRGRWNQSTIVNIGRNSLFVAVKTYGIRSMGDQQRMSPEGPRDVNDDELLESGKPRVIRNPSDRVISAPAGFDPLVAIEEHEELQRILDQRAGTQRGKPRSKRPELNPLGCRIWDMACGGTMYRTQYGKSFRYTCGLYQQSKATQCSHNHVDGPLAAKYVLAVLRQRLLHPDMLAKLEGRLHERVKLADDSSARANAIPKAEAALTAIRAELKAVQANLVRAKTDEQFNAVSEEFDRIVAQEKRLAGEVASLRASLTQLPSQKTVESALGILAILPALADDAENLGALGRLFEQLNAQMYLRFRTEQKTKRRLQKLSGGLLTFGDAPSPITKYSGPTGRHALAEIASDQTPASPQGAGKNESPTGREEKSLGNVSRGDRI